MKYPDHEWAKKLASKYLSYGITDLLVKEQTDLINHLLEENAVLLKIVEEAEDIVLDKSFLVIFGDDCPLIEALEKYRKSRECQ